MKFFGHGSPAGVVCDTTIELGRHCLKKGRYLPHLTSSMLPDLAEPCRGRFTTPLRVYATATTLLNTEPHL